MYAIEKKSKETAVATTKDKLLKKVRYLSQLLKVMTFTSINNVIS